MPSHFLLSTTLLSCACGIVAAAELGDVQLHGYASQGYLLTSGADLQGKTSKGGTFDFNDFGLNATATPIDRLRIGVQLFASDLGKYGNDEVKLDWAYGTYQLPESLPWVDASVSAGRIKTHLGLYGDYRDLDMTRTMAFLPMTVYSVSFRDLSLAVNGVEFAPTFNAGALGSFEVTLASGGLNIPREQGTPIGDQFNLGGLVTLTQFDIRREDFVGITWDTPLEGLRLKSFLIHVVDVTFAGSNLIGTSLTGRIPNGEIINVGAEYQHGDLTLASEYSQTHIRTEITATGIPVAPFNQDISQSTTDRAAYLLANYQLSSTWALAVGYNWAVNAIAAPQTAAQQYARSNETRGIALGVRFDPTSHWLIKAEFQRNKGTSLVDYAQNAEPGLYWNLFALKTTYDF